MDPFETSHFPGKRRLAEECECISVFALRRYFGKKALLRTIQDSKPLLVPVSGGQFEVSFTYETHRLPGGNYASLEGGTARLWLICPVGASSQYSEAVLLLQWAWDIRHFCAAL